MIQITLQQVKEQIARENKDGFQFPNFQLEEQGISIIIDEYEPDFFGVYCCDFMLYTWNKSVNTLEHAVNLVNKFLKTASYQK